MNMHTLFFAVIRYWHRATCLICIILGVVVEPVPAQQCTCPTFDERWNVIDDAIVFRDSVRLQANIAALEQTGDPYCRYLARVVAAKYAIKGHFFDKLPENRQIIEQMGRALPCKDRFEADRLHLLADYYQEADSVELATQYAFNLLKHAENRHDVHDQMKAIGIIATIYVRQGQDMQVRPFLQKALTLVAAAPQSDRHAEYYNWLAVLYENFYTLTETVSQLDSAEMFVQKAMETARHYRLPRQIQAAFQVMEAVAYHRGDLQKSLACHDSAYHWIRFNRAYAQIPHYFQAKALTLAEMNEPRLTELHQDSAIYYARLYLQPGLLVNYLRNGAEIYKNVGQKDKAFDALKASFALKDSLSTVKRTRIINELEQKYEKEKNENTILQLKHQKRLLGLGLALLAVLCGLLYLTYRQKILKQKQVILETEQRLNRARMNPHFFFNALASLQSFALNESDSMVLAENLSMFSHIMRETLENTYREYNSVQQEIDFLNEYLQLQQLRFPGKFTYNISNTLKNSAYVLIPSMIVQTLSTQESWKYILTAKRVTPLFISATMGAVSTTRH
jgi:hypothetical protein